MDKFIRKHHKQHRSSVDGMLNSNPGQKSLHNTNLTPIEENPDSALPPARNRLDDFGVSEGFRAARQNVIKDSVLFSSGRNPRRGLDGNIDLTLSPAPKRSRTKLGWKKRSFRALAGVTVLAIVVVGFLFGKGYLKLNQIFKGGAEGAIALQDNVDPSKLKGEGDGRVNILLLGRGGAGNDGPDLTDTILVASIDPINKKASLLSVPRDLYYPKTSNYRVNSVFAEAKYAAKARKASTSDAEKAGFSAIEKVIQDDLGITIHYYVMIDFDGFVQAINTVGGVDINVDESGTVYEKLWDGLTRKNYTLDVKAGPQHFDGQRALYYARSRKTSPRGDFDRAERQRKLIIALKERVLSIGTFANPIKISGLLDAFGNHVQSNMSIDEVMRLYELGKQIESSNISTIGLVDPPNNFLQSVNIAGQSIQRPRAGLNDFSEIQNYVRNALKDGYLANENASVVILNGSSSSGLATKKANELRSYGYNVTKVGDAPTKTYKSTILVDMRNGAKKYTRRYLELRLGVSAVNSLPDSKIQNTENADFIIILGQ